MKTRLSGNVEKDEAVKAFKDFEKTAPEKPHDIKILTIVIMAHGLENDW